MRVGFCLQFQEKYTEGTNMYMCWIWGEFAVQWNRILWSGFSVIRTKLCSGNRDSEINSGRQISCRKEGLYINVHLQPSIILCPRKQRVSNNIRVNIYSSIYHQHTPYNQSTFVGESFNNHTLWSPGVNSYSNEWRLYLKTSPRN